MISQGKEPCTEIEVGAKTDIFNLQFKDSQLSVFCVTQVCRACHHRGGGHPITPTEGGEDGGGGCGRDRFEGVQSRPHPTASHRPQQARPLCLSERAPPGCGKTLLLLLKARQWLGQGHHVHVVSLSDRARAVSSLICAQLGQSQGAAPAVTYHTFNIWNNPGELNRAITTLAALSHNGLYVIVDEVDRAIRLDMLCCC